MTNSQYDSKNIKVLKGLDGSEPRWALAWRGVVDGVAATRV